MTHWQLVAFSLGIRIPSVHCEIYELVMGMPFSTNQNRDDRAVLPTKLLAMYKRGLYRNMFKMFVLPAEPRRSSTCGRMNVDDSLPSRERTSQTMDHTILYKGSSTRASNLSGNSTCVFSPFREMICLFFGCPLRDEWPDPHIPCFHMEQMYVPWSKVAPIEAGFHTPIDSNPSPQY